MAFDALLARVFFVSEDEITDYQHSVFLIYLALQPLASRSTCYIISDEIMQESHEGKLSDMYNFVFAIPADKTTTTEGRGSQ